MKTSSALLRADIRDEVARLRKAVVDFREAVAGIDLSVADLLKRMRLEIPGVRPRVLTETLAADLDLYRGFRHVFREAYGFELDWRRLRPLAERLDEVSRATFAQIERFADELPEEVPGADGL